MSSRDVNDRNARSEGFRDSKHRTRVINGEPLSTGCLTVIVLALVVVVAWRGTA